jgi:hypothetical protein
MLEPVCAASSPMSSFPKIDTELPSVHYKPSVMTMIDAQKPATYQSFDERA